MDVVCIGLSNIDLMAKVPDRFLAQHKIKKGRAIKVDELSFARLRAALDYYDAIPGGCAANTACGLSAYGIETAFFGKIGSDSFESLYRASFGEYMVRYTVEAGPKESSQCAVLVTPDGERSFAYMDGASWALSAADIDIAMLRAAKMIYTEIYLFEFDGGSAAKAVLGTAATYKIPLVIKIMDHDFAKRYAPNIRALAKAGVLSLIIGNHINLPALTGTAEGPATIEALKEIGCDVLMTANRDGAYYITNKEAAHFAVSPVENPKNTTGAGDQFAAGFLTGRIEGRPLEECMTYGANSARLILSHDSARPPLVNRHSIRF